MNVMPDSRAFDHHVREVFFVVTVESDLSGDHLRYVHVKAVAPERLHFGLNRVTESVLLNLRGALECLLKFEFC